MTSRFLITTADERTWKMDRPVLFLGGWCKVYSRRHIWTKLDSEEAAPYGHKIGQKDTLNDLALNIERNLFPVVCDVLNYHHKVQYSQRFWKIVVGYWFRFFLFIVINRYNTLVQCLKNYEVDGTIVFSDKDYSLATKDSVSITRICNDDQWNNVLYSRILTHLQITAFPIEYIDSRYTSSFKQTGEQLEVPKSITNRILKLVFRKVFKVASLFSRGSDSVIVSTYLPASVEKKLYLALGQVPQHYSIHSHDTKEDADRRVREALTERITFEKSNPLEGILRKLIFELLPVCYLEGFESLQAGVNELRWPKKPKYIFTSNSFATDELFKLWAASKVEKGTPYIIGQHGNNYGTRKWGVPNIEEVTGDKFITWGWSDASLHESIPGFIFKTVGKKQKYNRQGGLILVQVSQNYLSTLWDETPEYEKYWKDQKEFIQFLDENPKGQLTIRLKADRIGLTWSDEERWSEFDSSLFLDNGVKPMQNLISESRLIVHSYDSTGILENLSQEVPMIAFWQNNLEHLRESAKPYYQLLVDAGIVHLSPSSAADKINEIWDDVEAWWIQPHVRSAREQFCDRYAKKCDHPVRFLKKILLEPISDGKKFE
jgi:putative transferase (TIGR04331 family)